MPIGQPNLRTVSPAFIARSATLWPSGMSSARTSDRPAGFDAASGFERVHGHRHIVPRIEMEQGAGCGVAGDEFGLRHLVTGVT